VVGNPLQSYWEIVRGEGGIEWAAIIVMAELYPLTLALSLRERE
jgi:hypothetical protein